MTLALPLAAYMSQVPPQPLYDALPLRQDASLTGADAPTILNAGHDFVLMFWPPRPGGQIGHRIYAARWKRSFIARHAPDFSGRYVYDGETLDVCTRQDGVLGDGRMAAYLHSRDGGFSGIATGRWSIEQGGYAGVLIHSNDTTRSGPVLLYGHSDGWLRVRSGAFYLNAPDLQRASPLYERMDPVFRGPTATACDLLPPRPRLSQQGAPDLTGNYLSNYNESVSVCTINGSLAAAFSGLGYQQGFAIARWVGARGQWEGTAAEIAGTHSFSWRMDGNVLTGDWSVYNRTNAWPDNTTQEARWEATPDPAPTPAERELPFALSAAHLSLDHLCALLIAADSGQREDWSDPLEEEWVDAGRDRTRHRPARAP